MVPFELWRRTCLKGSWRMKSFQFAYHLYTSNIQVEKNVNSFHSCTFEDSIKKNKIRNSWLRHQNLKRKVHSMNEGDEFDSEILLEADQFEKNVHYRNLLFKDSRDAIIKELNNSASVEDVMNLVIKYEKNFSTEHITQTVLVLRDLQQFFYCYNGFSEKMLQNFNESLQNSTGFQKLTELIKNKLECFNVDLLSTVLYHINNLGVPVEDDMIQEIALILRNALRKDFHLVNCSKLLAVIFQERSIRPYYISLELLPKVISMIDTCSSPQEFEELTLCLNEFHHIVTDEVNYRYKNRVEYLLKTKKLKGSDCKTILNIALLLSYPQWRHQNVLLVSKCLLLLREDLDSLSVNDLMTLYKVFYKNQEPGELLNSIQRCSAKFLQQHEENECSNVKTNLELFSAFIYFSSPTQRAKFQTDVKKYLDKCEDLTTLLILKKLFSYVKISDWDVCERYWSLSLKFMDGNVNLNDTMRLCQNYISFNTDVLNFRHYKFEKKMLQNIEDAINMEELIFPTGLVIFLCFSLKYGAKDKTLLKLIEKNKNNLFHMKSFHYYHLSMALTGLSNDTHPHIQLQTEKLVSELYDKLVQCDIDKYWENIFFAKSLIIQNKTDSYTFEKVLYKFKEIDLMSSKLLESVSNIFALSSSIVPEVLNKCTEYIVNHPDYIIAFNAEKILHLCYTLAYYPLNAEKFFAIVTDIILRDQERLSGIAILNSALSLSFFNKLPASLIKQIFSVEFMDKLDVELANCYSKDKYPQRVRSVLMQLNRAVCLEYPEFNVPWFHKKYVEGLEKRSLQEPQDISLRITEYLSEIVNKICIEENVITPYGYHLDFVLSFDIDGKMVSPKFSDVKRRLALIVLKQHSYTRFYKHLKGRYQLKTRHLEILGYEVRNINLHQWMNLLYAGERLEFLKELITLDGTETEKYGAER